MHFLLPPPQIPTLIIQVLWLPREEKEELVWGAPRPLGQKEVGPNAHFSLE